MFGAKKLTVQPQVTPPPLVNPNPETRRPRLAHQTYPAKNLDTTDCQLPPATCHLPLTTSHLSQVKRGPDVEGEGFDDTTPSNPPPLVNPLPETRYPRLELRNWKPETRTPTRSLDVEGERVDGAEGPCVEHR